MCVFTCAPSKSIHMHGVHCATNAESIPFRLNDRSLQSVIQVSWILPKVYSDNKGIQKGSHLVRLFAGTTVLFLCVPEGRRMHAHHVVHTHTVVVYRCVSYVYILWIKCKHSEPSSTDGILYFMSAYCKLSLRWNCEAVRWNIFCCNTIQFAKCFNM